MGDIKIKVMGRKPKEQDPITVTDEFKIYEVIDIKMALPIGFKIKLKESVAKEFIEKGYLK